MNMVHWADKLELQFNTSKCHSIIFTQLKFSIVFYVINIFVLQSFDKSLIELGIVFRPNLSLPLHIERVCCKVLKILGIIKRVLIKFKLGFPLKSLILFAS